MSDSDLDSGRLCEIARTVGRATIRAERREEIEEALCDAVATAYPFAWCGAVDGEGDRVVPRAVAGDGRGYLDDVDVDVDASGADPWRRATDDRSLVVADCDGDADWARAATDRGFGSMAAVPVVGDGDVHSVLAVYAEDAFDDAERDALGEVGATAGHGIDRLVEREEMADRLREARQFERVVYRNPDAIAFKDRKGRYRMANDRFVALLGWSEEELLDRTDEDLFDPETASEFRARDRSVLESEATETRQEEVTIDGRSFVFETTRMPRYVDDDLVGTVTIRRDVTDRAERERDLRRKNERLDAFASVVSHDLRNPLDIAEGYVGKARHSGADEDFDEIESSIRRMKTIIDELLTLARADRQLEDLQDLELTTVADSAWGKVDTRDATLELGDDRTLRADEGQLRRFLENLFRNAVEHAGRDVTVRVGATGDGFFVEDDGPGIPAEKHDRAFEPGYTTDDDGTGLGLAIVGRIADAHGWSATLTDGTDGGVRVEVDLDDE